MVDGWREKVPVCFSVEKSGKPEFRPSPLDGRFRRVLRSYLLPTRYGAQTSTTDGCTYREFCILPHSYAILVAGILVHTNSIQVR